VTWHPTARLRWKPNQFGPSTLQQQWVRMDFNPDIAEGMPHEGAREWRDVPTEDAKGVNGAFVDGWELCLRPSKNA
jgi:hypothetical protein